MSDQLKLKTLKKLMLQTSLVNVTVDTSSRFSRCLDDPIATVVIRRDLCVLRRHFLYKC